MRHLRLPVFLAAVVIMIACGDKVTVPQPSPTTTTTTTTVVHSVTVTPPAVTLNVGDKVTLAASVDADAGVNDRTVTWSSSNTAIATVDLNGVVTAVAPGNASIIAASKADAGVRGAASITVGASSAPATITISSINTTALSTTASLSGSSTCSGFSPSAPVDITINVTPSNSAGTAGSGTSSVTHKNAGVTFTHSTSCTSDGKSVTCSGSGTASLSGSIYNVEDIETLVNNVLGDTQTLTNQSSGCKAIYNISAPKP